MSLMNLDMNSVSALSHMSSSMSRVCVYERNTLSHIIGLPQIIDAIQELNWLYRII